MCQAQRALADDVTTSNPVLYMAMELSNKTWKLALSDGQSNPRRYSVLAGDRSAVLAAIGRVRERLKLPEDSTVISCYEAGRDGFWIHRWLEAEGVSSHVVDSSSIEVNRRSRRAKTDNLDAGKLLRQLIRHHQGEKRVWSVVRVPTIAQEDARRLHRELGRLKSEHTAHKNRIRSLLVLHGIQVDVPIGGRAWKGFLEQARQWNGEALPEGLGVEIEHESQRLEMVREQIRELEKMRNAALKAPVTPTQHKVVKLTLLRGIGATSAWEFGHEMFGWREFANRREVGGYAGLTPTPYDSGGSQRQQGISKAGNRRVRKMITEIAWGWLRFQPESKLSRWYQERFAGGGARMRRIGIVALARKLLIALWRYVEHGEIPEGATLKATPTP